MGGARSGVITFRRMWIGARWLTVALLLGATACRTPASTSGPVVLAPGSGVVTAGSAGAIAAADRAAAAFTPADVAFMSGMIPHHAQAIIMSRWCDTHGANPQVRVLCGRIVIAQSDEIRMMRRWLAERGQEVPDSTATRHVMRMGAMVHEMMMPGMLTDEEMAALDRTRGVEFDRLFLTGMIKHHQGAIQMVNDLFAQPGAAQEETVFRFASDVVADQSAEIHRMEVILESVP